MDSTADVVTRAPGFATGSVRFPDGSSIVRPSELDWAPWALPGTSFKLLSVNRRSGAWSCIVNFEPGTKVPPQKQFGDCMIYVMRGGYVNDGLPVKEGHFSVETGSTVNARVVGDAGMTCYMMFLTGFAALGPDGRPSGELIDAEWAYEATRAHGPVDHIALPPAVRQL